MTLTEFDPRRLEQFRALGKPELAQRLIELFLGRLPDRLEALRNLPQAGPLEAALFAAHGLSPAAAQVGAMTLAAAAGRAELAIRQGDRQSLTEVLSELEPAAVRAEAWLRDQLKQIGVSISN